MAPSKTFRTYSRGNNSSLSCVEAMNILFAKNLTERKLHSKVRKGKNKVQIKELPQKIKSVLSDEPSLHVNFNDTFDQLLKGPQNNVRSNNNMSVKIIAKSTSTSIINHFSKNNSFSPMRSKLRSFKNISNNSGEMSSYSWFKQLTPSGERITNDLEVEKIGMTDKKVNKSRKVVSSVVSHQNSSRESPILLRSRVKLPEIVITEAVTSKKDIDKSNSTKEPIEPSKKNADSSTLNLSYNPIFTNSIREKILIHSSTPLISNKASRLVKQPVSPIKSVDDEVNSCILKSFEEIKSWEGTFPNVDPKNINSGGLSETEDCKSLEQQEKIVDNQFDDSFITVRSRKIKKIIPDSGKNENNPVNTKSFNLDEFERFCNKFKTRSFKLEDFERFHNSLTQQLTNRLTQGQVNKSNSISLKDFESFYTACQNQILLSKSSFLVKSPRTINYVTNRKHRLSLSNNSVNLSKKYLKLSKEFDLKNLIVVLDNILIKNTTEKLKRSQSLCQTAMMNSIIQKQPVVKLTRLSVNSHNNNLKRSFKAKNKLSLNNYRACRKFSSNYTPRRNSELSKTDSLPSSDLFNFGQLFINITRMPLNGILSPRITEIKDDTPTKKGRSSGKGPRVSNSWGKCKETEVKSDGASEKENEKSKNRNKDRKSFTANSGKKNSKLNSQQSRKSKQADIHSISNMVDYEEDCSDDERTGIKLTLLSESLEKAKRKSGGEKEYVAKILVGSVSDTELEVRNTNSPLLREFSKSLMQISLENSPNHSTNVSKRKNSSKRKQSTRVLRSYSNISLNSPDIFEKTDLPDTSPKDLKLKTNSGLSNAYQLDTNISYTAQDLSSSILTNKHNGMASSDTYKLREIVVNLTLHKSWDENQSAATRKSTHSTKKGQSEVEFDSDSNKTEPKNSKKLNSSVTNLEVSVNNTPKNKGHTRRLSARRSLYSDKPNTVKSTNNTMSEDIVESSLNTPSGDCFRLPMALKKPKIPNLKAGKSWRRSLLVHKRESLIDLTHDNTENANLYSASSTLQHSLISQNTSVRRPSIKIVPLCDPRLSRRKTVLQTYAQTNLSTVLDDSITDLTELTPRKCKLSLEKSLPLITAKDIVLKRCRQTQPWPFEKFYPTTLLQDCKKIGEGVYGEVFLYTNSTGDTTVMKVIPIEGDKMVNQERQKKFDEILSEIVIASELSKLRNTTTNQTSAFSEVQRICCVKGKYPKILLDLWEAYDDSNGSENDHPGIFEDDQLYIVLDLANGGRDLEAFVFTNAVQAVSMFKQVACALAVAEQQLQFEHRDLHWGNVLLKSVEKNKKVTCKHKGKVIESQCQGVEVTIIDFTLSRIVHDGVVIFNDLGQDPDLFIAEGDYQFEIYRLMRKNNSNNWQTFEPHTNILWLHYIIKKSITALRYKNTKTKLHKKNIDCLRDFEKVILNFKSVSEFVSQYY